MKNKWVATNTVSTGLALMLKDLTHNVRMMKPQEHGTGGKRDVDASAGKSNVQGKNCFHKLRSSHLY